MSHSWGCENAQASPSLARAAFSEDDVAGEGEGSRPKAGKPPVADGITNHTCRRTFASLLYEAGASPAYVMSQMLPSGGVDPRTKNLVDALLGCL